MSRIGRKVIDVPAGVTVVEENGFAKVSGPKGKLEVKLNAGISIKIEGNKVQVERANELKQTRQNHGTTRANIHNAVVGVSEGFKKSLELRGTGYKATMKGDKVELWVGYSHTVLVAPEPGVKISVDPKAPTIVNVEGYDKQAVGQTAARIRAVRVPGHFDIGRGVRYVGEHVIIKEKKTGGKK